MCATGEKLSSLVAPLDRYVASGEINSRVADLPAAMARVEADLETAPPATSLRADAEALLAATTAVLSVLDLDAPPCA